MELYKGRKGKWRQGTDGAFFGEQEGIPLQLVKIDNGEDARSAPTPFTTYSFFLDGKLVTNEILTEKKFFQYLGVSCEKFNSKVY